MRDSTSQFVSGILAMGIALAGSAAVAYVAAPAVFWTFAVTVALATWASRYAKPRHR